MQTRQTTIRTLDDLPAAFAALCDLPPDWLLVFGAPALFSAPELHRALRAAFPDAVLLGCSTAGEIAGRKVGNASCTITAVNFAQTRVVAARTQLAGMGDSRAAGERLGALLRESAPRAVMVLAPGVAINGSALVDGIAATLGEAVPLTGGLAGDDGAFRETWTLDNEGCSNNAIVAVGFCGDRLRHCHGSFGGWEPFGPARRVTRAVGNILYELDDTPALDIYKRYLGNYARGLPASALLFPFAMLGENHDEIGLIRTILGVNEADGSVVLAGEIVTGSFVKLMHASTDKLVGGATAAAEAAAAMLGEPAAALAVLVSCVGRKLVMGSRVDEEVEAVAAVFGTGATLTGFYSYGEISPFAPGVSCKLHNQTMTITLLAEAPA